MPSLRRSQPRLELELARVRRYEHPLSVIVVRVPRAKVDGLHDSVFSNVNAELRERHVQRLVSLHVGAILYDCLRSSDLPMWDTEQNQYVVALPESTRERALEAADRLLRLVPAHLGVTVEAGVAEFPSDGLDMEDLIARAQERCTATSNETPVETMAVDDAQSLNMVEPDVVEHGAVERRA